MQCDPLGMLGVPAYLATGDHIITYNSAFIVLVLLSAMAMYFLVAEWTAVPAAGSVPMKAACFVGTARSDLAAFPEWARIAETGNCLRVILLEDGETVHNAFSDRSFKESNE